MKRETAERWMLLEQSGELDPVRRWLLKRHLARHPGDRAFQDDMNRIVRDARSLNDLPDISAQVRAAIRVAAANREPRDAAWGWQPALVFTTLTLLLLTGWLMNRPVTLPTQTEVAVAPADKTAPGTADAELAWDNGIDKEISELQSQFAMASDDAETSETQSTETSDLETIATELLQLEGSKI